MTEPLYDLAVVGGGVNGCGIARDAAGRGAKVLLLERGDLAQGTSSASTKLIHGGLRYLEHYEFALVRESLSERERLWKIAPHIVWPMRFVLPHVKGLRPRWLLRLGLFLYDHIGGRKALPATQSIDLARHPAGSPLKAGFARGLPIQTAGSMMPGWSCSTRAMLPTGAPTCAPAAKSTHWRGRRATGGSKPRKAHSAPALWSMPRVHLC